MFVLRPSSPAKTAPLSNLDSAASALLPPPLAGAVEESAAEAVAAEPFIDLGLPVADRYNTDILRAMIQDPFRVFIYWEAREEHLQALTAYFPPADLPTFRTVLKLRDRSGGQEAFFSVGNRGRYWMMVFPDRAYEFEIGVRSPLHGYISLLRSNIVQTPRGTISPITAEEAEYHLQPVDFLDVMEKSGFGAEQSFDITVAAMPGTDLNDDVLQHTLHKFSDQVRGAIEQALSGGKITAEMIGELPESMRDLLSDLLHQSGGEIASAALMHYLPELLRETIEDEREWVADQTHPLHLSPRFFVGASEIAQVPVGELNVPKSPRRLRPGASRTADEQVQIPRLSSGPSLRQLLSRLG